MQQREESTLRRTDIQNSKIVTQYLEKNVYPFKVCSYSRKDDIENQIKGIDCTFRLRGVDYKCDEKAATAFINKPLKTFAFELSFINRANERQDGWLINKDLKTDLYCLIWIDKAKSSILYSYQDIQQIEVIFVKKSDILDYLKNLGWSSENLFKKDQQIRETNGQCEMGNIWQNGCKFSYSQQLVEKPINILIPREMLVNMRIK